MIGGTLCNSSTILLEFSMWCIDLLWCLRCSRTDAINIPIVLCSVSVKSGAPGTIETETRYISVAL